MISTESVYNFGGVVFDSYSGDRFDMVAGPFHFCDRFSFLQVLALIYSFFFFFLLQECVLCVCVCVGELLFLLINL